MRYLHPKFQKEKFALHVRSKTFHENRKKVEKSPTLLLSTVLVLFPFYLQVYLFFLYMHKNLIFHFPFHWKFTL